MNSRHSNTSVQIRGRASLIFCWLRNIAGFGFLFLLAAAFADYTPYPYAWFCLGAYLFFNGLARLITAGFLRMQFENAMIDEGYTMNEAYNLWNNRLDKTSSNEEVRGGMSEAEFSTVIQVYGKFMETNSPAVGAVADSSKLPYTKDKIKEALRMGILATSHNTQMRENLITAYIHLANWQDNVGDNDAETMLSKMGKIDPNGEFENLLNGVLEAGNDHDTNPWPDIVRKEEAELLHETKLVLKVGNYASANS